MRVYEKTEPWDLIVWSRKIGFCEKIKFERLTDVRHRQMERGCSKSLDQQGRRRFGARSVLIVRERQRREERQVCEPEGQTKGRRCLCEPLRQSQRTPLADFFNNP